MSLEIFNNQNKILETSSLESFPLNDCLNDISNVEYPQDTELNKSDEKILDSKDIEEYKFRRYEKTEVVTNLEMIEGIADYIISEEDLKYENWSKLTLDERIEILNKVEHKIASIEHRPHVNVMLEDMELKDLGYHCSSEHKLVLNTKLVAMNDPRIHREVINTIIHEGRHAYQHYNTDVKLIHESASEVQSWFENFYDPELGYYRYGGQKIMIPLNGKLVDVSFQRYYYQPVEIDARNFAKDVMIRLENSNFICKNELLNQLESNSYSRKDQNLGMSVSEGSISLSKEDIDYCKFRIKLGEIGDIDNQDEIQGHVKGYHVIDWDDTKNFPPIMVDDNVTVVKDHFTNKFYIVDSIGYKTELIKTTSYQEKVTGFKYTYENFGHDTIGIKDIRSFNLSEKQTASVIKDLQSYGFTENEAKNLLVKDADKAVQIVNSFKHTDSSLNDMRQLIIEKSTTYAETNISLEDKLNSEASRFQDELKSEHVYISGGIYLSDTWGGFDQYTTNKIKKAINKARCAGNISDKTYHKLMTDLKKASHYAV